MHPNLKIVKSLFNTSHNIGSLEEIADNWHSRGNDIVFTNGCFDLFHAGHAEGLWQARSMGDKLIVGVNSNESVRRLKGPTRPIISQEERAFLVASQSSVDLVYIFDEDIAREVLIVVRPQVYYKCGVPLSMIPEAELVEELGGQVVVEEPTIEQSTSKIIVHILKRYIY